MLALSNDHQLYKAAYNDNIDIDNDGRIETTYDNSYDYYGYFGNELCYSYSSTNGHFQPVAEASNHECTGGQWSGNFLNWATMTRIDLVRRVLYGGYRSVDTSEQTILERALIPADMHAFSKVFIPQGGAAEMARLTPYSNESITLSNVTEAASGASQEVDTSTAPPLIKVAQGAWPLWATGEASAVQIPCAWRDANSLQNVVPSQSAQSIATLNARVTVCLEGLSQPNCKRYPKQNSIKKPIGIMQEFGDSKALRFGLVSGSYQRSAAGGVLRRQSGFTAGNSDAEAALDEIDLDDGTFTGNPGIIRTVNSFRINAYDFANHLYTDGCVSPESADLDGATCTNWGNPIAELVLEALRYLAGKQQPSAAFETDDSPVNAALSPVGWDDPITADEWCAKCNILALTAGVNSFDRDQLAHDIERLNVTVETNAVGSAEGISGHYVLGGNAIESDGNCYVREIGSLSEASGVCPSGGKLKGGWDVAGIAYFSRINDFRSDRQNEQTVATRAIDMGESIPKLTGIRNSALAIGPGATLTPVCMVNRDRLAEVPKVRDLVDVDGNFLPRDTEPHGWQQCGLWQVLPMNLEYDADGYLVEGDLYAFWEDTPGNSDSELDAISRLHFCVGPGPCAVTGDPQIDRYTLGWEDAAGGGNYTLPESVAKDDEIRVTASVVQVYTDQAISFGFMIDGLFRDGQPQDTADHCDNGLGSGDGIYLEEAIPGTDLTGIADGSTKKNKKKDVLVTTGSFSIYNEDLGVSSVNPEREKRFCGRRFKPGDGGDGEYAPMLKPPLWYATKYGGFVDTNDNGLPDLQEEWDSDADGNPDGYHMLYAPQNIGESFEAIFDLIAGVSSSSSVVANTLVLKTGTYIYQGRFDSSDWSGDLVAFPVLPDGGLGNVEWSAKEQVDAQFAGGLWDTQRIVLTANARLDGGVPFRWHSLSAAQQRKLDLNPMTDVLDGLGSKRLDYVRGDRNHELQQNGVFRDRAHLLGDIVNSDPLYVGKPPFNYPDSLERYAPYSQFVAIQRDEMLYVGGNDGMLHGFDAETGEERFAYVPRAVYSTLPWLSALDYERNHRFYVDGGIVVGDVVLNWWGYTGDGWHSVLVGALGAGGRGVYALDITDPNEFSEGGTAPRNMVLWDITSSDYGFEDLGYTFSSPAIVRLRYYFGEWTDWDEYWDLGTWSAAFGNGYGSEDGGARLYLVGVGSGRLVASIEVDAGPGNGLSSVAPVDINGDYSVDYIYAGDLKGNLWRFEPTSSGTAWEVSNAGVPVFTARDPDGNPQPITIRPAVFSHPYRGVLVVFGTGKFFETSDAAPNPSVVQTLYGVWDRLDGTGGLTRDHLLEQEFIARGTSNGYDLRVSSDHEINWHTATGVPTGAEDPAGYLGWRLDLLDPSGAGLTPEGELIAAEIRARGERVIFTSMIPSEEPCEYGGEGWLIELSYLSGRRPAEVLFDLDDDGVFDERDMLTIAVPEGKDGGEGGTQSVGANAKKSRLGIIQQPAIIGAEDVEYKYASGGMPADVEVTRENPGAARGGRASWLELE
jgi:type IV pilus assembly protein PilY1